MKKTSSVVWRFFDRVEENNRCVSVLCKLCDHQYKYFGNTTNLRTHLVNKHPIQWELLQNGSLDESTFRSAFDDDESTNQTITPKTKRRKYAKSYNDDNVRYSISVNKNEDNKRNSMPIIEIQRVLSVEQPETDNENNDNANTEEIFVEQLSNARGSDEEWLNDEIYETVETYEPKRKKMKYKQIKREVETPPKFSNYVVRSPLKYQKPERIVIDSSPKKDEYSVFGEYIANKLRKFKGSQTRGNVQQLITTILWQAEYGIYDNMDTVRRVILHSVQEMAVQDSDVTHVELQETSEGKDLTESEIPKESN